MQISLAKPANRNTQSANFPGGLARVLLLGRLYVASSYIIIFSTLFYALAFFGTVMVVFVRSACSAQGQAGATSWLYGMGSSPICGNSAPGQILALAPAGFELLLVAVLVRDAAAPRGTALPPSTELIIRAFLSRINPRLETLQLRQWTQPSRISSRMLLFSADSVREFARWQTASQIDAKRPSTHRAVFTTLHELGHLALYDVFYNRGADRAVPTASIFVALYFLVAMPAGKLVGSYWLSVVATGCECVTAVFASRLLFGRLLTNIEFIADAYAAAQSISLVGNRLSFPPFFAEGARTLWQRSHPALSDRKEYLRSMTCSGFMSAYLMSLPLMALLSLASTPTQPTIGSLHAVVLMTNLTMTGSLCVLGVLGGGTAAPSRFPGVWGVYGVILTICVCLTVTQGAWHNLIFAADAAHRLLQNGMHLNWCLILAAPLAGVILRARTGILDAAADDAPAAAQAPRASHSAFTYAKPRLRVSLALVKASLISSMLKVFQGFVTLAAAEAAVFGYVVLVYVFGTGILSWVHLTCFLIYFAVPFSHAMRPASRVPLVFDALFQTLFLSMSVIVVEVIKALRVISPAGAAMSNATSATVALLTAHAEPGVSRSFIVALEAERPAMLTEIKWLFLLMACTGVMRLAGQHVYRRRLKEDRDGNL